MRPAGFEEDWTASGLCELGDLKHKWSKTDRVSRTEKHFRLENDLTMTEKKQFNVCLSTCKMATHHLVVGIKKLSVLQPGRLRNSPIYCSLHAVTRMRKKTQL